MTRGAINSPLDHFPDWFVLRPVAFDDQEFSLWRIRYDTFVDDGAKGQRDVLGQACNIAALDDDVAVLAFEFRAHGRMPLLFVGAPADAR
ncbi:hypothetical protein D3C84_1183940 [compost metagenome]